jgi:organic radical activating enzyme
MSFKKFEDSEITAKGDTRASVKLTSLKTLWFNTGTQCNLSCVNCYIESNPTNDRLVYITTDDVKPYLQEIKNDKLGTKNISFTGGEPFINPHIIPILSLCLEFGHEVLVLTNAFKILNRHHANIIELKEKFGDKFKLRISLDHYTKEIHEKERGTDTFDKTIEELKWLYDQGFNLSIAGRSILGEDQSKATKGYQDLLDNKGIHLKLQEDAKLVIFPEMHRMPEVPEITTECWGMLNKTPEMQMCSTERMIVRRKGRSKASVLACTLLAYDEQFELGNTLAESRKEVSLNHPWCAEFCVLGGASCSSTN